MAKVTRSTRIFKDDDSNNSKSKQISGSTASETSGSRRSTRDTSSKKEEVPNPSSPQTQPTKRRSERIENQSVPSPVSVSEESEKHHSLNSSGSKKFVKCSSSSVTKGEKEKMEKGEKQLKLNSGVHTRNEKKNDLEPVPVILKKKRFDARSYRAFIYNKYIKPRESKAKELDLVQTLKGHGHHENTGDSGSKKVEDHVKRMKHKNRQEEGCKSKNGDSSPVSNNGDSYFPLSSLAAKSKEAIVDADKMQVNCSTREEVQKSESMGSPSEGRSLPGDHDFERAEVGALKRKKLDMDFNASVMEDSEKIGASTAHAVCSSPSGSKESILSSICVSCSKRQRVDFDSQIIVCSCRSQRIHDLCNTSLPEEVCEEASCARSPQNSEMAVSCIQKDGTTRDVDLIDVQKEDDADLDGSKLFPNDGSKAGHDQIGLPGRIVIPITVEEDGTELEATACSMEITGECSNGAQLKDSSLDIQPGSNQDTCVVCKLGGKILCCDGNGCKKSYHLSCLNPPLKAVPRGAWYCLLCVKKRIESGEHSVSGGVESIWDVREVKLLDGEGMQKQYFVKYRSLAHVHNRWVPESQLLLDAPMLVVKFEKNQVISWKKEWTVPQRLLQKRLLMTPEQRDQYLSENQCYKSTKEKRKHLQWVSTLISNLHYEWFVKWRGLGYEHATWELENAPCLRQQGWTLKKDYESRRKKAKSASDPSRADKVLQEKSGPCFKLSKLPGIFKPGIGNDHLCFVNKLRECWHKSQNTVVMDDKERVMKVILFIVSLHYNVCRPFLIISTSSALSAWEAEFMCLAPSVNVVVYSGNRDVRETIRMLEFYEEGGSTMFQVLLSHADAIVEDLEVLNCLEWEAIVVDECQQSSVSKHFEQIKMLTTELKVLLTSGPIEDSMVEYLNLLSFIDSEVGWNNNDYLKIDANVNIDKLKEIFGRFVASGLKSDSSDFVEYWVPVRLSHVQLEQYCATLLSNSMSLRSCSKNDPVGALHDILISTRKCCDHPYIVDPSLQGLITKGLPGAAEYLDVGVNASGKLQLLDKILAEIVKRGLRALILFQSIGGSGRNHIGDILEDFVCQRFGPDSYERVESGLLASKKQFALNRFNNKESGRFVFLVENRACHASIKLSSVDIAILFDSDWNPINDLRALQRITIDSEFEQLKVFRLYSSSTLEEKALILAKQDMALDNNVQNISCSTSHMLLKWGASCLFKKLDEFHGCNLSHGSIISSEQSLLNDVMKELLEQLPNDAGRSNTSNCSIILKVKQTGLTYSSHISLLGELEMQSSDEEPPHVFWPRLLEGRCPRWRFLTEPSPRVRKKVQYFDVLQKRSEVDDDDTVKRRKKVVNNTSDPTSLNTWVEDKRKIVNVNNEGASEIPVSNGSQLLPRPTVNTDAVCHSNVNSELPEIHTVEPEERRQLSDSQKNLHRFLKPEISKLCEILQLPEDVKGVSGKFLEYVMNNHCVSREPATIFQAFQISLCWTAASLLKQKINHKETLALARKHLNFECKDEEADSVYSKLRELKKMFSRQAESAMGSSSAEGPSRTRDAAEHLVHGRVFQAAADDQQELEEGEIRESSQSQNCSGKNNSPKEQAIDSKKVNGSEENDYSKSILQVKKIHSKRMKKLLKKQMNDYTEFNEKKLKIRENSKARLEKEHKMESTLVRAMHSSQISVRSDKLKIIDQDLARKIKELNSRLEIEQKRLEDMQRAAINEEERRKSYWLKQAKAGRPVDSFSTLPLSYSGFRWEDMESTEQDGVSDAPKKNTIISEPSSEEHGTDGMGTVEPGETIVAEAPKIVQNEVVDAVIPTELTGFAVHSSEENNSIDTMISEREIVDGVKQHNGRPGASDDGGSPLLENTLTSSPLAQVLPVEDSQDSQLFGSARLQGEDMSSRELQSSSPQVVVSSIQPAEALSSDQSIHDTLVLPPVVRLHLRRPTNPASSEHNQSGSLACTVIEHITNTEMLTASEQLQLSSQPPVLDQSELFNISVPLPGTQLESDHQLRHTFSQQAQVSTQPPAEDQAEIFSHSVPQSETQLESDNQLRHTSSQQAQVPTQPPAEDQAKIFYHSVPQPVTQLESDHQLRHTSSQQAQVSTQPPAEDQAEIFSHSVPQPETQLESDYQLLHASSQQAQVQTQPAAEDEAEISNYSVPQPETQLESNHQLRYTSSQQAQIPTQPAAEDQAEISNDSVPQSETQLESDHQLRHTSSQQAQVPTQPPAEDQAEIFSHAVLQCETQLECSNVSYNPSQQAEVPTQPPDSDVSTHPPVSDQAGLFDHSNPQPETQLEHGHLSSNICSQQVQLQIPPPANIYVQQHSVPQCNTQSQLHTSMERPSCGSGLRISETRSLGVVPESNNRPLQTAPVTPLMSQPDTLQIELARIRKEEDQVIKFHEDLKARIDTECEKEIEEARRKYNSLLQDAETAAVRKRETLEANYNKVYMNIILAEVIRFKCSEPRAASVLGLQQGAHPGFLQQLLHVSSQQNVQRPFSAAGPPAAPPIQVVHHSSALFSGNPVRPHYNSVVPPTRNYQVGGQVQQFPAPHLQHFRPSTSISAPNQHSLSPAILSQQSLGISSAASSALPHRTIYPPNYSSGSPLSTTYQSETAIQVPFPCHSSSMHELPRNIDNGPGRNPQNLFTQPNHGLPSVNLGNLQDPTARVMNTSSGDVVCLSDDDLSTEMCK